VACRGHTGQGEDLMPSDASRAAVALFRSRDGSRHMNELRRDPGLRNGAVRVAVADNGRSSARILPQSGDEKIGDLQDA